MNYMLPIYAMLGTICFFWLLGMWLHLANGAKINDLYGVKNGKET